MKTIAAAACVLAVLTFLPTASSRAHVPGAVEQPGALIQRNCHEIPTAPFVDADAAQDVVGTGYDVDPDGDGRAELLVNARRCESVRSGGVTALDAIDSYVAIAIAGPDRPAPHPSFVRPAEQNDSSDDPGFAPLEFYVVQWVTNSALHAKWLKQAGLGNRVKVVDDLRYDYEPFAAVDDDFVFEAPAPASSPFHIEATVTEPGPQPWTTGINLWADTDEGTSIVYGEQLNGTYVHFGPATGAITSDDSDSPLGRMFGTEQTRPLRDEATTGFASARFSDGQWTKCIRTSVNPCDEATH